MFAMYSYIAPTVTDVTHLGGYAVPVFLLAFGIGGILGTLLGGAAADWSVLRAVVIANVAMGLRWSRSPGPPQPVAACSSCSADRRGRLDAA